MVYVQLDATAANTLVEGRSSRSPASARPGRSPWIASSNTSRWSMAASTTRRRTSPSCSAGRSSWTVAPWPRSRWSRPTSDASNDWNATGSSRLSGTDGGKFRRTSCGPWQAQDLSRHPRQIVRVQSRAARRGEPGHDASAVPEAGSIDGIPGAARVSRVRFRAPHGDRREGPTTSPRLGIARAPLEQRLRALEHLLERFDLAKKLAQEHGLRALPEPVRGLGGGCSTVGRSAGGGPPALSVMDRAHQCLAVMPAPADGLAMLGRAVTIERDRAGRLVIRPDGLDRGRGR